MPCPFLPLSYHTALSKARVSSQPPTPPWPAGPCAGTEADGTASWSSRLESPLAPAHTTIATLDRRPDQAQPTGHALPYGPVLTLPADPPATSSSRHRVATVAMWYTTDIECAHGRRYRGHGARVRSWKGLAGLIDMPGLFFRTSRSRSIPWQTAPSKPLPIAASASLSLRAGGRTCSSIAPRSWT